MRRLPLLRSTAALLWIAGLTAQAATITVNSTADVAADDGQCTLREAIVAANTNTASGGAAGECVAGNAFPTIDTIAFAIAGSGVHTITPTTVMPDIGEPLVIDGYTQPGASVNTLAVGNNAVLQIELNGSALPFAGLFRLGDGSTIRGLIINRVPGESFLIGPIGPIGKSNGNTIAGNFIGTNSSGTTLLDGGANIHIEINGSNNTIGGTAAAARNVIAGAGIAIQIDAGSGNLIQGNYIGVNAAGTAALPASDSLAITGSSGPANVVGGAAAGAGNVLVGSGSIISVQGVGDTLIQGNLIGTNATGTAGLNGGNGIFDTSSGSSMIIGNVLSGLTNLGIAIEIETLGVPTTKVIRGNKIGTDVTGTVSIPNNLHGVFIVVSPGNGSVVGGTAAGEGNIIAFNGGQGVDLLGASSTGWAIVGNSIFSNGGLGISLSNSSVPTPNDSGDADTGANNLQNFPVITSTVPGSGTVAVSGTLNSAASSTFLLEFFASTACDGSGNGEGQTFIGSTQVTTNASGNASFGPLTFVQPAGTSIITATATSNPGNIGVTGAVAKPDTSEFSACLVAPASPPPPAIAKAFAPSSIAVNGTSTLTFTITNTAQGNAALTGVAFTDTLPAGLVVATPNGLSGTCGAGTVTAAAGGGSIALSGGTLAAGGSCTISVNVTATSAGTKTNNTGPITSTESGQGGNASVDLIVTGQATPPTITKSFNPTSIALNGTTTLSFALTNPNASATLNNIGFSDTLPAGLVVATPNGLTGTCGGGTIAATTGSGTVSLSGATIAASGSCTLSVNVTGTTTGTKNNSVQVSSTNGGNGNTANASVTVTAMLLSPATLSKSFGTATLAPGGVTTLSFTLTNPNTSSALTGVGFTDTLPGGLVLSTPNGLSGSCGGGTITAVAGSSSVSLSGATLAASAACTFTVNVTANGAGPQNNVTSAVTSIEAGNGDAATASLVITAPPAANIPALQDWALALLGLLLSISASRFYARRGTRAELR